MPILHRRVLPVTDAACSSALICVFARVRVRPSVYSACERTRVRFAASQRWLGFYLACGHAWHSALALTRCTHSVHSLGSAALAATCSIVSLTAESVPLVGSVLGRPAATAAA
jgi:hypothetical protein